MKPKVSIIILNWNGWEDTIECLESVYQINYPNFEIIVVDNHSENNSIEKIKEYCSGKIELESDFFKYSNNDKPIDIKEIYEEELGINNIKHELSFSYKVLTIIKNKKNYGFAKGNNIGIEYSLNNSNSDYVFLLNNDTVVKSNFLTELINIAESNEDFGIFSPIIYQYYKPKKIQYSSDEIKWYSGRIKRRLSKNSSNLLESDTICGASMLIKKDTIKKIGMLPEEYFMLWEDVDYSIKAKINNIKCGYVSNSNIWHKGSISIGKASSPLRIKCSLRNRIIFWKKYSKNNFQLYCFLISVILIHLPQLLLVGLFQSNQKEELLKSFYIGLSKGFKYSLH